MVYQIAIWMAYHITTWYTRLHIDALFFKSRLQTAKYRGIHGDARSNGRYYYRRKRLASLGFDRGAASPAACASTLPQFRPPYNNPRGASKEPENLSSPHCAPSMFCRQRPTKSTITTMLHPSLEQSSTKGPPPRHPNLSPPDPRSGFPKSRLRLHENPHL